MIEWLNANSPAVSAITSIGTFVLTIVLAWATWWYAKSAHDQTSELRATRTAAVAPHVRVSDAKVDHQPPNEQAPLVDDWNQPRPPALLRLKLTVQNVGAGPAIAVRLHIRDLPKAVSFEHHHAPNIPGQGAAITIEELALEPSYALLVGSLPLSSPAELQYTDVLDQRFTTRFRLRLLRTAVPDQLEVLFDDQQWVFGAS